MFSCSIYPWMTIAVHTHKPWPLAKPIGICIGYYGYIEISPSGVGSDSGTQKQGVLAETILLTLMTRWIL